MVLLAAAALTTACLPADTLSSLASGAASALSSGVNAAAPRGYERLLSTTDYGFRYSVPGEPVRLGARSERYELRDGDCVDSDCGQPRYRTEVRQTGRGPTVGKETWIGWSFYNAGVPSYARASVLKTVFGQWKLDGALPSAIRVQQIGTDEAQWARCDLAVCTRPATGSADVVLHLEDVAQARNWGPERNNGYICPLFTMSEAQGKWTDIVLHTNFGTGADGFINAWVNGAQVCRYRGPVVASAIPGQPLEHRRGIFVNYSERWDSARPGQTKPTLVAFYDEYRAGPSREEVDVAYRASGGFRPLD